MTTIYVTHDQAEALSMSDRIAVFNYGVCHQVGTPSEIYNEPVNDFVASFIGEINLFPVKVERIDQEKIYVTAQVESGTKELVAHNHPFHQEKGELSLSIRPEAVKVYESPIEGFNIFKGKIEDVDFFGSVINLTINVEGMVLQVNLLNTRSHNLQSGATVWVQLPEDQIRIIPVVSGDVS